MAKERLILVFAAIVLIGSVLFARWWTRVTSDGAIEIVAADSKFVPSEIRARVGEHVKLRVRATDRKHGIIFKIVAEGQPAGTLPGLRFAKADPDWILIKGEEVVIEFVAERPGRFEFACSVFCGMGHNEMRGRIIVE